MSSMVINYAILASMIIFLSIRFLDVCEKRKCLNSIIGHYNKHVERLNLPIYVYSAFTETFRIWDWSYEGMIVDEEIRNKIGNYIKGKELEFNK